MEAVDSRKKELDRLFNIRCCALLTTGRTGSDLLQSLLDSHPEILGFAGVLFYHDFWKNSICVAVGKFDLADLIDEFVGKHIEKFKSRYDIKERRNQLGQEYDQYIDIDIDKFKREAINALDGREINSRNFMIAIYIAYALCLNQDISSKRLLFHHIHHMDNLDSYLKDFPESKIIIMTRDPRANFVSGVEHWRKYDSTIDHQKHIYVYIKRILADSRVLEKYNKEYIAVKIEDLGKEAVVNNLCKWLGIAYNECLKKSTWAGLLWPGDKISAKKNKSGGWSAKMLKNNWQSKLSFIDKYVLNYIMYHRLKSYGYEYKRINVFDAVTVAILILLPLKYELRFFSPVYLFNSLRSEECSKILRNLKFYLLRIFLFFKYYVKTTKRKLDKYPCLCE